MSTGALEIVGELKSGEQGGTAQLLSAMMRSADRGSCPAGKSEPCIVVIGVV